MKLLFVSTLFPSRVAPTRAAYNRQHLAAMQRLGHEVRVLAPVPSFPGQQLLGRHLPPKSDTIDGLPVVYPRFAYTPGVAIHQHWRMYRAGIEPVFRRMASDFRPDALIVGFAYPDAVAMGPVCRELGLPYGIFVLGSDFRVRTQQPRFRDLVTQELVQAPTIFCPGRALARDMAEAGFDADRIVSFDNGVDQARFRLPENERRSGFVCIGNLVPVKGIDRLLAAWARFLDKHGDQRLTVIGDGREMAGLREQARELGIADSVDFAGRVPHAEIPAALKSARCLVLASRSEGMPNVVVEALACGTPVVATAVGEVPFLIEAGVNGLVVTNDEAGVVDELASALDRVPTTDWNHAAIARTVAGMSWERAAEVVVERLSAPARESRPRC